MNLQLIIALCVLMLGASTCDGYNVLIHHSFGTKSHLIQMSPMVEGLLNNGHTVTAVIFDTLKIKQENYTEIVVPNGLDKPSAVIGKIFMEDGGKDILGTINKFLRIAKKANEAWASAFEDVALQQLKVDKFQTLMNSDKKFDLLITSVFYHTGAFLADKYDCPIMLVSPPGPISFVMDRTGNTINLSVQPSSMTRYIEPLSFLQRIENHMARFGELTWMKWLANSVNEYLHQELGKHTRHSHDIIRDRLSVILSASHPVTHGAWPYLPNFIELGGLHLRGPKTLPEDLKKFMDSATEGVVLVSFGSSLKPGDMPEEKLATFLETFKRLNMSVIWKWDSVIPDLPQNVITKSWLPQQDLLGHPNLKVFVTHGGLGSVMEAIYHKTVLVGVPLMNDQIPNLLRAAKHGYARTLKWDTLTADELTDAITAGVEDKSMQSAIERIHNLYVDRQQKPVDSAVWWIEYVCRHGGAEILQSHLAEEAPWYQYHHIDVLLFIITVLCVLISVMVIVCCTCYKCCCKRKLKTE